MNPRIKKIVLVVQDLKTKEKETVAVVSGDIHLLTRDKKKIISFQLLLDDNKEFSRSIRDLVGEALTLHDNKENK